MTIKVRALSSNPNYGVSRDGVVYRLTPSRGNTVGPVKSRNWGGKQCVELWCDGKRQTHSLASLIAEAFVPNPDGSRMVGHKDGDSLNNAIENLYWMHTANRRRAKTVKEITDQSILNPETLFEKYT